MNKSLWNAKVLTISALILVSAILLFVCGNKFTKNGKAKSAASLTKEAQEIVNIRFMDLCDYTGGMGIDFYAPHTLEYEYRQQLKTTDDAKLKRLFVLWHLFQNLDSTIEMFERGIKYEGKGKERVTSMLEHEETRKELLLKLTEIDKIDLNRHLFDIEHYRTRI